MKIDQDDTAAVMAVATRPELVFVAGHGSWLFDHRGKRYLDFVQGWAVNALGHCPPEITHALASQSQRRCGPIGLLRGVSETVRRLERSMPRAARHMVRMSERGSRTSDRTFRKPDTASKGVRARRAASELSICHQPGRGRGIQRTGGSMWSLGSMASSTAIRSTLDMPSTMQ